jgi:NADPH-dependent 2,4-dienoyl-CoA reductase/sulfur reductase-like enzyme
LAHSHRDKCVRLRAVAERVVVIGGDAGGMTAATNARRTDDDLEITVLERGRWASYSACGIPYLVSGAIEDLDRLVAKSVPDLRANHRLDVRLRHEAMEVDVLSGKIEVRDHTHQRTMSLPFDQLVIATGSRPLRPDLPGIDHDMVHGVQTLDDAEDLLAHAKASRCRNVVVVGGGYIGLEMAEAFVERGARVTVVEAGPQVMRTLDADMAARVENAMRATGIDLRVDTAVTGFEDGMVHTADGDLDADLVVLGLGVVPNSELAASAGVELGARGAIKVDPQQRTNVAGVWAAGDCCESYHQVSRRPVHVALGTVANKQGRVAGINLGGGYATFPGVVGTALTRICSTEIARTGLTEREAVEAGLDAVAVTIQSTTRAGYLGSAAEITVKMLAERGHGRLLGAQIVGGTRAAKRIDVVATAITAGMTVNDVVDLDLGYAPPFSPLWDPVQVAARQAAAAVAVRH